MPRTETAALPITSSITENGKIHVDEIPLLNLINSLAQDEHVDIDWSSYDWQGFKEKYEIPDFDPEELIHVASYYDRNFVQNLPYEPRKDAVRLITDDPNEPGGLPEKLSKYLLVLIALTGGPNGPVGLQFIAQPRKENPETYDPTYVGSTDSLNEDDHEETNGVIHKFENRALVITTRKCAAYCRFCTRGRRVDDGRPITVQEIDEAIDFILKHPEIKELIFSGGDPFTLPKATFKHLIDRVIPLQKDSVDETGKKVKKRIRWVRFGSRFLIHTGQVPQHILDNLERLPLSPHVMLHINHTTEITLEVKEGMDKLRKAGARLYSQTVLLAGVNDTRQAIKELMEKVDENGGVPYYVFTCDPVAWGSHFKVGLEKIKEIFWQLRKEMTGVSGMVRVVIDVPGGHGKITLDEGFWISARRFRDYKGKIFEFDSNDNIIPVLPSHLEKNSGYAYGEKVPEDHLVYQHNID
ncbi:MAG: lysine 2,3-aminomutase [Patescibacteria group bacterium]|nr:lysine 2,3-aminomutase [Patescibacteria group bacterium]